MFLHVVEACHRGDYRVWLRFNNGAEGEVNLADELEGEVFGPLKDAAVFRDFYVDAELETIVWPGGADFAPEYLLELMMAGK